VKRVKRICLVGADGHGKTTLLVELIPALIARGLKIGTIKHSGHVHELDKPGKDSHRHRQAGARPAGIVTEGLAGVFVPLAQGEDGFEQIEALFAGCDLILIEGYKAGPFAKIEVFRSAVGGQPLAAADPSILAVISDDSLDLPVPVWPRSRLEEWIPRLLARAASADDS
jgi:molybdopterin-guanine dinucleotide biosynthesis protein B